MAKKEFKKQFDEDLEKAAGAETEEAQEGAENVYTYVGQGEDPPRKINFMNKHEFVRGKATAVEHPEVLAKLKDHPCFVKGEVEQGQLHDQDAEATADADAQRKEDRKVEAAFRKQQKKLALKGEEE